MRTRILLITCCVLLLGNLHAQVPDWNWASSINGPGYDYINALTTDGEGNVYCTGGFTSPSITLGSFTLINSSNPDTYGDLFVAKIAPDGTVLWAVDSDGPHGEGGEAIALDQQGNIYVLGSFGGIDFTYAGSTFTSQGATDLLLVKYAPSGTPLWARKAASTGQDDPGALTIDPDGNAIISGQWQGSTLTVGSFTTSNAGALPSHAMSARRCSISSTTSRCDLPTRSSTGCSMTRERSRRNGVQSSTVRSTPRGAISDTTSGVLPAYRALPSISVALLATLTPGCQPDSNAINAVSAKRCQRSASP